MWSLIRHTLHDKKVNQDHLNVLKKCLGQNNPNKPSTSSPALSSDSQIVKRARQTLASPIRHSCPAPKNISNDSLTLSKN